jgi:5-formyltetrahydrofolate cyclo-ligase
MDFTHEKGALRETITTRRRTLDDASWQNLDEARLAALLKELPPPGVIAIYASRRHEPDTLAAIKELRNRGWQVLLPKLSRKPDWAWATSELRSGWAGIPEPSGSALGIKALEQADVIVVPCLAVSRDGARLGMGGGWYDRALRHRRPGTPIWALANADEVLPRLPSEPHDIPVDAVVTENGFTRLGARSVS